MSFILVEKKSCKNFFAIFKEVKKPLGIFKKIPIRFVDVELKKSLKIAKETNMYCYDAYLLRCCQKYNSPLITLDKKY